MQSLLILPPAPIAAITGGGSDALAARLATPSPREAYFHPLNSDATVTLEMTLTAAQAVTRAFLGFATLPATATVNVALSSTLGGAYDGPSVDMVRAASPVDSSAHYLGTLAQFTARRVRYTITLAANATFTIGVARAGLGFQPIFGHEYGAGRPVIDTGTADRLQDGGFSVDEGVRVGGYQWTFGDLQAAERERLYEIALALGVTRNVIVVEDPEPDATLFRRIHYGLFRKLDPYERIDPLNTKWGLTVEDWA